ncbi:MAG: EAL domain-containing protein [Pseudanabaenaceae cyanobacterium]
MEKRHLILSDHVSPEDWDNTPSNVRHLVNTLLASAVLSDNESYLARFLDATLIGIAIHRSNGQLVYINSVGQSLLGTNHYPETSPNLLPEFFQIYRAGTNELYPIENLPSNRALRGETIQVSDLEVHRLDRVVPLEVSATPVFNPQGQVVYVIATFRDISERHQADAALQKSELKIINLTNAIPGAVFQFQLTPAGELTMPFVSQGLRELAEVSPQQVVYDIQVFANLILLEDWQAIKQTLAISAETLQPWHLEFQIQTGNQGLKWILGQAMPRHEPDGIIIWNGILTDISDRKRREVEHQEAELALQQSEDRFREMAANISGAIFRYQLRPDGSKAILYMSPGCYRIWEVPAEILEKDATVLCQMVDPQDQLMLQESIIESAQTLQPWSSAWRIITPSGCHKWLEASGRPEKQPNGEVIWDVLVLDVSDRKFAEERIREQQTQLDLVVESSQIGFYIHDLRSGTSVVSSIYKTQLGYPPDAIEPSANDWQDRLHPEDRQRVIAAFEAFQNRESVYNEDFRLLHRDGSYRWIHSNAQLICDEMGMPIKIVGTHIDITDRKKIEENLRQAMATNQALINTLPDLIVRISREGIYLDAIPSESVKLVVPRDQMIGKRILDVLPIEFARQRMYYVEKAFETGELQIHEYEILIDNEICYEESRIVVSGDNEVMSLIRDISDRKRAEISLRQSESRYRLLAENINDLVCLHDPDGRYIYVSPSCQTLLGYHYDEMLGKNPEIYCHPDDRERVHHESLTAASVGKAIPITYRVRQKSGDYIWFETLTTPIMDDQGQIVQLQTTSRDVTERIQVQNQLEYEALHDALTGLPNRNLLMERLELSIHRAKRIDDYRFAVLFLDLDRFKVINDSLGHLQGDQLLIAVAQKLQFILRDIDLVARLGGDEFVILLDEIKDVQDAIHATQRIFTTLQTPMTIEGREVYTTCSIGIVVGTNKYTQASDLLRDADTAMYRAKNSGKARYEIFDAQMHQEALRRMHLENDLRRAIDCEEFVLHYQPIICLNSGSLVGFEALMRWQHPTQGLKSPGDFIPVAEEIGLITSLSAWALRTACQQLTNWQIAFSNLPILKMSVNLSVQDLRRPDLVAEIDLILAQTKLDACCLTLEITESMLIEDIESITGLLTELKRRGIQLSLDDFGTGYSSLSYLHQLPMDNLKIDQSFVNRMQEGKKNYQIVETIATLSRQLELDAIAEGIETSQQLERLKALGYKFGQGYLFSQPLSGETIETLLGHRDLEHFVTV